MVGCLKCLRILRSRLKGTHLFVSRARTGWVDSSTAAILSGFSFGGFRWPRGGGLYISVRSGDGRISHRGGCESTEIWSFTIRSNPVVRANSVSL